MEPSAQKPKKTQVLITSVGSYLGAALAKSLLGENCEVFGQGKSSLILDILPKQNFTLLELDLTQPLPSYLPSFDLIFYLDLLEAVSHKSSLRLPGVTPASPHIISQAESAQSKIFVFAPITQGEQYDYLVKDDFTNKFLKMFLVGDLYGPGMPIATVQSKDPASIIQSELSSMIFQAIKTDKVILENEGLKEIYPAYITDVIFGINKFVFGQDSKNIHTLISEGPQTSLSVAYEIQNTARLFFGKELGLFFAGSANFIPKQEPIIRIHDFGFEPKVKLTEGLKNTFGYFAKLGQIQTTVESKPSPQFFEKKISPRINRQPSANRLPLTSKIPQFSFKPRLKTALILVGILLFLAIAKTGLDIYLGISNLNNAKDSLLTGDFGKATAYSQRSAKSLRAAAGKAKILLFPISFVAPQSVKSLNQAFLGAKVAADATLYFIIGTQTLARDLAIISSKATNEGLDLETPAADFKRAYLKSAQARQLMGEAKIFVSKFQKAQKSLDNLNSYSAQSLEFVNLAGDLTALQGQKTYLILLQNNSELRPGGGFIGNFGLIEFAGGHLKNVTVEDTYTIDGQLKEKIEPPKQLKERLGIDQFYLRDSNWTGDFQLNSATARDFYKKETGKNVDGVIAVDLTLIQNLLKKIGAITLADYNEEITADNLFEQGEYYSEIGFFPGSTQKRDFFATLTRSLITKILEGLTYPPPQESGSQKLPLTALIETFKQGLESKHLMATFDNPNLTSYVHNHGWDHPLPPANFNPGDDSTKTRDFLAITEANLGANKVNRFLERKVSYEMTIGRDADLVARLTIAYTNNSQAETWPAGKYVNFLRLYVPLAAGLEDFKLSIPPEVKRTEQRRPSSPVSSQEDGVIDKNDVEVTTQGNLTVFSTFVEVPIKSTQIVTFTYRIPKNIKLEQAPAYHLYVQKQAGTEKDPFEFKFNLPAFLEAKNVNGDKQYKGSKNITIDTDLSTDRQFEIEVVKK